MRLEPSQPKRVATKEAAEGEAMTKTETDFFPLISESIASMRDPQRFSLGEYVLVISHCQCNPQMSFWPARIVELGEAEHKVALTGMVVPIVLPIVVYDILKLDSINASDEL